MNYVALKMLFGDRAKYLMLLCGLTFAVMLIVQQGSIFWGLMIWSTSSISNLNVPIWVTDPGIAQVDEVKPIADTAVDRQPVSTLARQIEFAGAHAAIDPAAGDAQLRQIDLGLAHTHV